MTLTSYANRKVSSTAMPLNLTFTPSSPPPPLSHTMSTQSSHPSLINTFTVSHCVQSPHSLAELCCPSCPIPFVLEQSDPTVDEYHQQFPHHCFPYHHVPMNHQMKDYHLHPKSFAKPAQLHKFADSGCYLSLSKVPMPYLLTIYTALSSQPVISDKKGVCPITCGHLHVIYILVTHTAYYSASLCIHCLK